MSVVTAGGSCREAYIKSQTARARCFKTYVIGVGVPTEPDSYQCNNCHWCIARCRSRWKSCIGAQGGAFRALTAAIAVAPFLKPSPGLRVWVLASPRLGSWLVRAWGPGRGKRAGPWAAITAHVRRAASACGTACGGTRHNKKHICIHIHIYISIHICLGVDFGG